MKNTASPNFKALGQKVYSGRPSLQDVAKLAGVSAAAVSYVVNGRTSEVGPKTLQKIKEAIKTLKYQPQRRGLSLRFNREFAIGLVIVDPNPNFLSDPFTTEIATGLSNALAGPGYGLTVTGCASVHDLNKLLKRPIGVDAFVVHASGAIAGREQIYGLLSDINLPVVVIQDDLQLATADSFSIRQDDFDGATMLAQHLLKNGAKRYLFIAPACIWPAIERREAGIRSVLPKNCDFLKVLCEEHDFTATAAAVGHALDQYPRPDAIMGANDQIAIAALSVLQRRGISVPHDIQVTGYNDFTFRNYVTPLLTTIKSRASDIGRDCASAILARLESGTFVAKALVLPVTLDLGETTR